MIELPGDYRKVLRPTNSSQFDDVAERAGARLSAYKPITVAERFEAFAWMGFRPHGLFFPHDERMTTAIRHDLRRIGGVEDIDARLRAYHELQDKTELLFNKGVEGRWTGQQAWARSEKRFRLIAVSRRGGKTMYAAAEALAELKMRPRSHTWVASGTMELVGRCFSQIMKNVKDMNMTVVTKRDQVDQKFVMVQGGASVEGVSLDERALEAGDYVDLAIVDEGWTATREAIHGTILPPLADRQGRLLVISSYKGEENYFHELAQDAATSEDWDFFDDIAYEVNFYAFARGRESPAIKAVERMSVNDMDKFLEEYGNIPAAMRRAIYPQYRDSVHAGNYPYVPGIPVIVCIDPSSGGENEYAVSAVQDYGDHVNVIDEYYRKQVMAEDVIAELNEREWREDVKEGVCDSAVPIEVRRWRDNGWNILAIDKPRVEERIPVYRRLLRDPFRFYPIFLEVADEVLEEWGEETPYELLSPQQKKLVHAEVEAKLSSSRITPQYVKKLRSCARLFINAATCPNLMQEHKTYAYRKPPKSNNIIPEAPRKWKDHLLDGLGYFAWRYKRHDGMQRDHLASYSYLKVVGANFFDFEEEESEFAEQERRIEDAAVEVGATIAPANNTMRSWLAIQRGMNYRAPNMLGGSILRTRR